MRLFSVSDRHDFPRLGDKLAPGVAVLDQAVDHRSVLLTQPLEHRVGGFVVEVGRKRLGRSREDQEPLLSGRDRQQQGTTAAWPLAHARASRRLP